MEGSDKRREGERKEYWGVKRTKVYYIYTHEDSIMKPTKHWSREEEGEGEWKYNGGRGLVEGTLYTCMELSQWNPLVFLIYYDSKI
jgi:hypothetical protein